MDLHRGKKRQRGRHRCNSGRGNPTLPHDYAAHFNLGVHFQNQQNVNAAVLAFETAHRLRPDVIPPLVNGAIAYSQSGKLKQAEQYLNKALRLEPENTAVLVNLALLYGETKRLPDAQKTHLRVLELDPTSAVSAYNLCVIEGQQDASKAIPWCTRAVQNAPDNAAYIYSLAYYQLNGGQEKEARLLLEKTFDTNPNQRNLYTLLASLYEKQSTPEAQVALYRKAAQNPNLSPGDRAAFQQLADAVRRKDK